MNNSSTLTETDHAFTDENRLMEIARLGLVYEKNHDILHEYVEQAAHEFDLPISLVSVVLPHSQFVCSSTGLSGWMQETQGLPLEWSFCANSVLTQQPYVVKDALHHPKESTNPIVTEDDLRCYAGVPLITKNKQVIGNFCVAGYESHSFSEQDIDRLKEFAGEVMALLEHRAEQNDYLKGQ